MGFNCVLFLLSVVLLLEHIEAGNIYTRSRTLWPTNEDRDFCVKEHNFIRRMVQPSATNMAVLRWDRRLEHLASKHAKQCKWEHSTPESRTSRNFKSIGENMVYEYGKSYRPNFRRAIKDTLNQFKGEGRAYDYVPNKCKDGKSCKNYLQAIWAETEAVGCAVQQCPSLEGAENTGEPIYLTVCNYGNAGNWVEGSEQKPYVADPHGWSWYNLFKTLNRVIPVKNDN